MGLNQCNNQNYLWHVETMSLQASQGQRSCPSYQGLIEFWPS